MAVKIFTRNRTTVPGSGGLVVTVAETEHHRRTVKEIGKEKEGRTVKVEKARERKAKARARAANVIENAPMTLKIEIVIMQFRNVLFQFNARNAVSLAALLCSRHKSLCHFPITISHCYLRIG